MGSIKPPKKVKLFVGLLSADRDLGQRACQLLRKHYGQTDLQSEYWPFGHTDYYLAEMGENLERHFVCFDDLIYPDAIAEIKRQTIEIEARICHDLALPPQSRPVNLDPGYMSLSKLVLATTKDYSHRIYLRRGIYAEVTLRYHDGGWQAWPWTYPDYASEPCREFFLHMRERLKSQITQPLPDKGGANQSA